MWPAYGLIFGFALLGLVVYWARQDGKKSARLAVLKKEVEEAARAQNVLNTVYAMPGERVRKQLKKTRWRVPPGL